MPAEKTLNPRDVEGLEKSLNDSATRVSTIWITYLVFGLYLLVSAGTATDKQLLLADSVKLPALGTDVPLVAFFVISPVLFVLQQFYVLLQTLLLGRTAKAYNDELDHTVKASSDNAVFRERLANTNFAQIFAGAPRERDGWVGNILLGIAWFTLLVSPILVLLTFQFAFLPYRSQGVTWVHRGLIYAELVILFTLWPAVLDPAKEFDWHRLDLRIWRSPLWSQKQTGQLITILVLVLSTFLFSFPGEWHINLLSGRSLVSRDCTRWLPGTFGLHIDRLVLKDLGTGSDETSKTANNTPNGADLSKAASLRDWSDRDFACGTFVGVDFHRTILDRAHLEGGVLTNATIDSTTRMEGVYLEDADLSGLTLFEVKFLGAHLNRAKLSEAKLTKPNLRRADLTGIDLSGATLTDPEFEEGAYLSGANLIHLTASGLTLLSAHLEGAGLQYSTISKSNLKGAILDGADLYSAALVDTASDWASAKAMFGMMPPGWGKQPAEQFKFANDVADIVCTEDKPKNIANRSEIVTAIVANATYPDRNDPACPKQDPAPSSCPTEQPKEYRNTLADRLSVCASTILSRKDIDDLRSEFSHPGKK